VHQSTITCMIHSGHPHLLPLKPPEKRLPSWLKFLFKQPRADMWDVTLDLISVR